MKYLHFWLILLIYFSSFATNYTDITPVGLPQSSQTGMCFLNIDDDEDLEFVYSYIENKRQVTRIYQTQNGNIRTDLFFEVEGKFLTNLQPVAFTSNGEIQFLAVEPFKNNNYKFSLFEIEVDEKNNIIGLEEIATSFSSIFFRKITYDIFDFDNDGDLDIFFIGEGSPTVTEVLLNQGNYIFKNIPFQTDEYTQATITHYDFTEDGFQDVYLAGIVGNDTLGKLFENVDGKFLKPFKEKELNIPAVVNGQVIIQRFNNNSFPDIYIRGEKNKVRYSAIYELQLKTKSTNIPVDRIQKINDLPYFTNGFAQIHDFNNDGFYDVLSSGFFPLEAKSKTQIAYQNDKNNLILEDLAPLSFSNAAIADMNQDGVLEIVLTGLFSDTKLKENLPKTFIYSSNANNNTPPFFNDPLNDLKITIKENTILLTWKPAEDDETTNKILFYEVHLWNEDDEKLFGNSSKDDGFRLYPYKGMIQDTFMVLKNIPAGKYQISVQAIDNGLFASEITEPKTCEISFKLPKELFNTFEIVQFRGEDFKNKFEIVDLDADGYKDFLLLDKNKELTFLVQKEINVFQKSDLFSEYVSYNQHFELGDYTLDGFLDTWFLEGDTLENELFIFDTQDSVSYSTGIENLESFILLDIDNDLDLDIIADSRTQNGTVFYENVDGIFELVIFSYNEFLRPVGVYDFNKDSYLDFYFITDTIVNKDTLQNAYLGINNYNQSLGKESNQLFLRKKILANQKFKVIDSFDAGTDGDWDLLIETIDDYAILENKGGGKWEVTPLPFSQKFDKSKTQVRLADFDGDLRKEAWRFSIDTLEIFLPQKKESYKFATNIYKKDENWGNTNGQKALQWIKIVDLNADGWNDLLAHVIINNKPQTYYFPNYSENALSTIESPKNLTAKPSIGRATLKWNWNSDSTNARAEYLLEMKKIVFDGEKTTTSFLNFDGVQTVNNILSTQTDNVNYLGTIDSLQINNLLEGDYIWRVTSKIDKRFSSSSSWDTLRIHNFLRDDTLVPPIHHANFNNLSIKGGNKFSKSADFDNDGDLDFLFIGYKNYLYINQENKKFDTIRLENLPAYGYADVKIIHYNHDNYPDLMISGISEDWTTPSCYIFENTKHQNFTKVAEFPAVAFGSIDQADIDNDGDWDYVLTGKNKDGKFNNFFIQDKRLPFAKKPSFEITPFVLDSNENLQVKARFIDEDNDGWIDLFCSVYKNEKENYLTVKKNAELTTVNTVITPKGTRDNTGSNEFIYTDFGDYDHDGYLDLISVGISPSSTSDLFGNEKKYYADTFLATTEKKLNWTLTLYQSTGDGFRKTNEIPDIPLGQNRIENIQFWDVDNDGDLDFFIQQAGHIVFVEMNDNENFELSTQMRVNSPFSFSTFGDFKSVENTQKDRDTRLDFILGSIHPSFTYTLEKNNVANENDSPFEPNSSYVEDPVDGSKEGIFNGIQADIEWNYGTDDEDFGTYGIALQYLVAVYRNDTDTLISNYRTHNPFISLENLEDGTYFYEIKSIDEGGEISDSSTTGTFEIWMDPIIEGDEKACQSQLTTYRVSPNDQDYTWKIIQKDTTYTLSSFELGTDSIGVTWDTSSSFVQKIIITNDNYPHKRDTLEVKVFKKPIADFIVGNDISIGAIIPFTNASSKNATSFQWDFDKEITLYSEENIEHTFLSAGRHTVRLTIENEIGCTAQKEIDVEVSNNVVINTSAFITQNNDGKNDFLYIQYLDRYPMNKIHIYNQWGQKVYEIENYNNNNWTEKLGDTKLTTGNYFLIVDVFIGEETQTFKSTFSVLK